MTVQRFITAWAEFDPTRKYRYELGRTWDESLARCCFIMLNPSTATATVLDPTVRRCVGFAERWGYGSLVVGNLFALRATNPAVLAKHSDPVGPENNDWIDEMQAESDLIVLAWGSHGVLNGRGAVVAEMLAHRGSDVKCFGTTKAGEPKHPLYLPNDAELVEV